MKKITDLTEARWRTVHLKDENGNRYRETEDYTAHRTVKTIAAGPRFGHYIIDGICYNILLYVLSYFFELIVWLTQAVVPIGLTFGLFFGISLLLLYPAFYAFCEYTWQRTPGKFLTKTIVIDEYGNKPDLRPYCVP